MEHEAFIVYIATLSVDLNDEMYPLKRAQIAYLKANKALTKVFNKYADIADILSPKLAAKLFKNKKINNYTIK